MSYPQHLKIWLKYQAATPFSHCNQALCSYFHEEDHSTSAGEQKHGTLNIRGWQVVQQQKINDMTGRADS